MNNLAELLKVTIVDMDKLRVSGVESMAIVVNCVNRISAVIQELEKQEAPADEKSGK